MGRDETAATALALVLDESSEPFTMDDDQQPTKELDHGGQTSMSPSSTSTTKVSLPKKEQVSIGKGKDYSEGGDDDDDDDEMVDTILQAVAASTGMTQKPHGSSILAKKDVKKGSISTSEAPPGADKESTTKEELMISTEAAEATTDMALEQDKDEKEDSSATAAAPPPPGSLSRGNALRPSHVISGTPGAHRVRPQMLEDGQSNVMEDSSCQSQNSFLDPATFAVGNHSDNSHVDMERQGSEQANMPHISTNHNNDHEGLAVANKVEEDDHDVEQPVASAVYVDPHAEEKRQFKLQQQQQKERYRVFGCGGFLLMALVFALVIPLVLISNGNDATNDDNSTNANSTKHDDTTRREYLESLVLPLLPNYTIEEIQQPLETPQSKALDWVVADPSLPDYPNWRIVQRFALATFYFSTGGVLKTTTTTGDNNMGNDTAIDNTNKNTTIAPKSSWFDDANWLSYEVHECDWFQKNDTSDLDQFFKTHDYPLTFVHSGRPCVGWHANRLVDGLDNVTLSPDVHDVLRIGDTEGALAVGTVQDVWIWFNGLQNVIPKEFFLLTSVRTLALMFNDLQSPLQTEISQMSSLTFLDLASTGLTGTLPSELGSLSNITYAFFLRNQFTGTIPSEFGNLPYIDTIQLDGNQLTGSVPTTLSAMRTLTALNIEHNQLTGFLPTEFGLLTNMRELTIGENPFNPGPLPSEYGLLPNVTKLRLHEANFTGNLPETYAQLSSLNTLRVEDNMLTGPLPSFLTKLTSMFALQLHGNQFTGTILSELGTMTNLTVSLRLNENNLTGPIPSELGLLTDIGRDFRLSNNQLTGRIPSELAQVSMVREFWLHDNMLTGQIPEQLFLNLNQTTWFYMQNNLLNSTIPTTIGYAVSATWIDLRNNSLTGAIPSEIGLLVGMDRLLLSYNDLSGSIPPELGELVISAKLNELHLQGNPRLTGTLPTSICHLQQDGILLFDCGASSFHNGTTPNVTGLCGCNCDCFKKNR